MALTLLLFPDGLGSSPCSALRMTGGLTTHRSSCAHSLTDLSVAPNAAPSRWPCQLTCCVSAPQEMLTHGPPSPALLCWGFHKSHPFPCLTLTLTHSHTYSHTLTFVHSHTIPHTHTLPYYSSHPLTHKCTLTPTLTHFHTVYTHTHTHTHIHRLLILSSLPFLSPPCSVSSGKFPSSLSARTRPRWCPRSAEHYTAAHPELVRP